MHAVGLCAYAHALRAYAYAHASRAYANALRAYAHALRAHALRAYALTCTRLTRLRTHVHTHSRAYANAPYFLPTFPITVGCAGGDCGYR
jgi:hypothetical protein